jgi:hypothetical protein
MTIDLDPGFARIEVSLCIIRVLRTGNSLIRKESDDDTGPVPGRRRPEILLHAKLGI